MAITKNRQSEETISSMAKMAFPDKQIAEIRELTEGMCNVTYAITFKDGSESILKIAAKDRRGNTSNEVNLMQAEINAMKLVAEIVHLRLRMFSIMILVTLYAMVTTSSWKNWRVTTSFW